MRIFMISTLVVLGFGAWFYVYVLFSNNKSELIMQLADITEEIALPYRIAKLSAEPAEEQIAVPIQDGELKDVANSFKEPRSSGRSHDGVDIFAERGTPIYAAVPGYVIRVGEGDLGGMYVWTIGAGGRRYYYAHLDSYADGIERGDEVTQDTIIGYVGNSGNASTTPSHLHFGIYGVGGATNPYPLLVERS